MSTTVADLKAALDGILDVYRDGAPDETALPYAVILDDIDDGVVLRGDGLALGWAKLVQVDVWQAASSEDDTLVPSVIDALDGLVLDRSEGRLRCRVESSIRVPEPELGFVHQAITVRCLHLG